MTSPFVPPAEPRFVGRGDELAEVVRALGGGPSLVLVEGERGAGRSRFVAEAVRAWRASTDGRDVTVVHVACPVSAEQAPLGPVIAALRDVRDRVTAMELGPLAGALRAVLPEWSEVLPEAPEPLSDPAAERYRIMNAVVDILHRGGPGLIVADDAHRADPATLDLVATIVADPTRHEIGVLVTFCADDDADGSDAVRRLVARRDATRPQHRIILRPFDRAGTADLIASVLGDEAVSDQLVERVHADAAGLPAAVHETVAELRRSDSLTRRGGMWTIGWRTPLPVPPITRDVILDRVRRLSPSGRTAVEAAAVMRGPVDVATLVQVTGADEETLEDGLAEAIRAGLVSDADADQVVARSPLVARVVEDDLPRRVRRRRHARALDVLGGADPPDLARLAEHAHDAGRTDEWRAYGETAAAEALAAGNDRAAAIILHDLVADGSHPSADLGRLALALGTATVGGSGALGDIGASVAEVLRDVLDRDVLDPEPAAELRALRGRLLIQLGEFEAASAEVEAALDGLGRRADVAVAAMTSLAFPRGQDWPARRHVSWLNRSRGLVADLEPQDRLRVSVDRVTALLMLGHESGWREAADFDAGSVSSPAADRETARLQMNVGHLAILWGRDDEARRRLDDAIERMRVTEYVRLRNSAELTRAHLDYRSGRWDGLAARVAALADVEDTLPEARLEAYIVLGLLALATGDRAVAEAHLAETLEIATGRRLDDVRPTPAAGLGRLYLRGADVDRALDVTRPAVDVVAAKDVWIWGTDVIPVQVRALTSAGERAAAAELTARFEAGLNRRDAPATRAAAALCRGIVAAPDDPTDAAVRYAVAAELWRAVRRPFDRWLAEVDRAEALIAAGDPHAAVPVLVEAHQGLRDLGATWDADRAAHLLRTEGVDVPKVWRGGSRGYGDQLSPREIEVAGLVARGLTNRQVAAELSLSPRTVDHHLGRAMRKLGVRSRTALAVAAHDAGLLSPDDRSTDPSSGENR